MVRTPCSDKNGMKKGSWSQEEDNKLRAYILRYGHSNWRKLPKYAGISRCGKSCRLRWMNYLKPNLKRGNFSEEEDNIIMKLHDELGNRWSVMAAKLPGRTDNDIKNYWHTHLKKRVKQNGTRKELKGKSGENSRFEATTIEQSIGDPQFEADQSRKRDGQEWALDSVVAIAPSHQTSESSDYAFKSCMDWIIDDGITSSYAETIETFWTQPFLVENETTTSDLFLPPNFPSVWEEFLY